MDLKIQLIQNQLHQLIGLRGCFSDNNAVWLENEINKHQQQLTGLQGNLLAHPNQNAADNFHSDDVCLRHEYVHALV
jgi:hypothetical protein